MFTKPKNGESAPGAGNTAVVKKKEFETFVTETLRLVIDSLDDKVDVEEFDALQKQEFNKQIQEHLETVLKDKQKHLSYGDKMRVVQCVVDEMFGFGPINSLVIDPQITEIMVNSFDNIYIEVGGKLSKTDVSFRDNNHVLHIINKIINPIGRRIDESCPSVDARLPDGSRVNAIIPPLALKGPSITIRKFSKEPLKTEDLIDFGTLTDPMASFIRACVRGRLNIIVSGGTGSGKTTTLNTLSSFIPDRERIVTIEDTAELKLSQDNVVTLESRPANIEGKGEYTIRELVRNSLRMRPDRIVVGEVRGGECLDMLQAMNTGHDGSISTLHANNPREALARLETMVLMAGMELPLRAIREQVAAAIDLIIQQSRLPDGTRKIVKITEVMEIGKEGIEIQDIFSFRQQGIDNQGMVLGQHEITGVVPRCLERLASYGENILGEFPEWEQADVAEKKEEKEIVKVVYVKETVPAAEEPKETLPESEEVAEMAPAVAEEVAPEAEEEEAVTAAEKEEKADLKEDEVSKEIEVKEEEEIRALALSVGEPLLLLPAAEECQGDLEEVDLPLEVEVAIPVVENSPVEGAQDEVILLGEGSVKEEALPGQEGEKVESPMMLLASPGEKGFEDDVLHGAIGASVKEELDPLHWKSHLKVIGFQPRVEDLKGSPENPEEESTLGELVKAEAKNPVKEPYKVPTNIQDLTKDERRYSFARELDDLMDMDSLSGLVTVCTGPEKAEVGQTITYVITVENKSEQEDLSNVVVTGSKFDITKKIAFIAAGQSRTLEINYAVKDRDVPRLENKVIVFALKENGEELVSEEKCVTSVSKPEVRVFNKGPDTAAVGQVITYTIVVTNSGKVPLTHVVIMDSKQDWTQKLESLAAGLSQTYEAKYTVSEDDYPTLESIVTVKARNQFGQEVFAEDMHNVFVALKEEEPEVEEKPAPGKMGLLCGDEEKGEEEKREERPVSIASLIPEDMRGVSLPMNEITALSGLVQQGDRVDVLLVPSERESGPRNTRYRVVEDAVFLKENRVPEEKRERAVFLAVTPEQAEDLAMAYSRGSFCLVMRSAHGGKGNASWASKLVVG